MEKKMVFLFLIVFEVLKLCETKLYQVLSLSRHGARYHERDMWDGNDTKQLWAQLTAVGMRQHQTLGKLLRKQYIQNLSFLSETYQSSEIEAFSTSTNRTIQSLQSQLYGMYPPGNGPKISQRGKKWSVPPYSRNNNIQDQFSFPLGFQPIIIKQNQRVILHKCPSFYSIAKKRYQINQQDFQEMKLAYTPFIKRISEAFNFTLNVKQNLQQIFFAYDDCNVNQHLGRPWPKGISSEDYANLKHLAAWHMSIIMGGDNTLLSCSGILKRMMDKFALRIKQPSNKGVKWTFVSAHEEDIVAAQLALNITSSSCIEQLYRKGETSAHACLTNSVQFASNLIFQLHSDNQKDYFIKVKSGGNYVNIFGRKAMKVTFLEFQVFMNSYISANLDDLCGRKLKDNGQDNYDGISQIDQYSDEGQIENI